MWRKTPAKRQAPLFSITLRLCLVLFLFSLSERRREWKILLWIEHLAFYCGVEDRKWIRYSTRSDPIGSTRKPPVSSIPLVMTSMYVPNSTHLFSFFFQISLKSHNFFCLLQVLQRLLIDLPKKGTALPPKVNIIRCFDLVTNKKNKKAKRSKHIKFSSS